MALIDRATSASTSTQREVLDLVAAHRSGRVPLLYRGLALSPNVARGWLALGTAIRFQGALDDDLRELLICYVATVRGSRYELEHHVPLALQSGVPQAVLDVLHHWRAADIDYRYQLVLRVAERMLLRAQRPTEEDLEAAARELGDAGALEILAVVSYYSAVALLLVALGIDDPS